MDTDFPTLQDSLDMEISITPSCSDSIQDSNIKEKLDIEATNHEKNGQKFLEKSNYNDALKEYLQCLEAKIRIFGAEHSEVARIYEEICNIYKRERRYKRAHGVITHAIKIYKKNNGEDSIEVARCYTTIGILFYYTGEHEKSLENHNKALKIRSASGEANLSMAESYFHIATVYDDLWEHELTLEYFKKCLEIEIKCLGENHPDVGITYNSIGSTLQNQGKRKEALEAYNAALNVYKKCYGEEDCRLTVCYENLVEMNVQLKNYREALENIRKCLRILLKEIGSEKLEVLQAYNYFGLIFEETKVHNEALFAYKRLTLMGKKIFGKLHWRRLTLAKKVLQCDKMLSMSQINDDLGI